MACVCKGTCSRLSMPPPMSACRGEIELDKGPRVEMTAPASGFNLLERADLDEAIEVSAKHPMARYGVIELRPIAEG